MTPTFTRILTLAALPLASVAGAAQAGGVSEPVIVAAPTAPVMAPVVMTGADWTGAYAGASLGYGRASADLDGADPFDDDPDGAVYGVFGGYNYDLGSIVLGAELQYEATNITNDLTGIDVDGVARLKVRAGYDAGAFMPYVTAGVAQLYTGGGLDADDRGAFGGVGVDYRFGANTVIGGEILYHEFDDFDDTGIDLEATTASLRVSFMF